MDQWRADRMGCDGARMVTKDTFSVQRDKILALTESDIVSTLGTPDLQELSKRNQKFYYYYLEPHGECATADSIPKPLRVAIRFNAIGLAKEVRIEKNY
jgi:outer membrane protein assembly factor BamE (lipoprotein component of BamABCDE complex)